MVVVVVVLALVVVYQQIVIHRLLDRLLVKAGALPLGPVIQTTPEKPEKIETRKKLFSVNVEG